MGEIIIYKDMQHLMLVWRIMTYFFLAQHKFDSFKTESVMLKSISQKSARHWLLTQGKLQGKQPAKLNKFLYSKYWNNLNIGSEIRVTIFLKSCTIMLHQKILIKTWTKKSNTLLIPLPLYLITGKDELIILILIFKMFYKPIWLCRDVCIHRIEKTVIEEISTYSTVCKSATEDIKSCHEAQEKEMGYQKHVNKLRQQNPLGRMQITKAESDLQQAVTHSVRLGRSMEDRVDKLEKKKLEDLHQWMKQLILIEMSLHSSALSILAKAFRQINQADISSDLEVWKAEVLVEKLFKICWFWVHWAWTSLMKSVKPMSLDQF